MVTAVNSAVGSGTLTIGVIGYYDYNNSAPPLGGNYSGMTIQFSESPTGKQPYLGITYAAASGYGQDVAGVATSNIEAVVGVATGNIEKVIGVD